MRATAVRLAVFLSVCGTAAGGFAATTQTGSAFFQYAAFATSNTCAAITFTGNSTTDSFDSSQGTYAATKQNTGGNIGTNGNIRLNGNVDVHGTASSPHSGTGTCNNQSPTAVTSDGKPSISGGIVLLATPMTYGTPPAPNPPPPTSNQDISGACGNISGCTASGGSKNLSLAPGSYGNVSVSGRTTIHLQAGTYNINTLTLRGNSDLVVDSTPVFLNVVGQGLSGSDTAMDLTGGSLTNATGKPSGLEIVYAGTAAIKVSGGPDSYGLVYAPNANVLLGGGADWFGAIIASTVTGVGNSAIHYDRALGNALLAITANPDPAPNAAGWNNTNVTVSFRCSGILITSCSGPASITTEAANQQVSGTATDIAGNSVKVTVAINLDKTAPTVTPSRLPAANAAGWNNTNVTVSFVGNDTLSGVAACTAPATLSNEGRNQSASGTCTDVAGNVSPPAAVIDINIDKRPPTLAFSAGTPAANAAGWNNTNVSFPFTTADNLSGVASTSVPNPLVLSAEGAAVTGTVTVTDLAGNSATFTSPSVKMDKTPPVVTFAAAIPAANAAGWNNADVSVSFRATDLLSGLASTSVPSPITLTAEGSAVTGSVTATDVAGNTATYNSPPVKIDKTPPTAQAAASPAANPAGWNNTNVTVTITGADALSGIAGCSAPVVLSTDGRSQSASGSCTDNAGNASQPASVSGINIDKTAPTLTFGTPTPLANAAGWNNTNVAFPFTAADALSGVATTSVPGPLTLTTEGASVTGTVTVTDVAGNSATFTSPAAKIDKTAPTASFAPQSPAANAAGWNKTDVAFAFTATDALSGVASTSIPSPLTLTAEGNAVNGSVTVTDVAGNTLTVTSPVVKIEKTLPTAQAAASPQPNAAGWNNTNVTVSFSGTNSLSGITSCSAPVVLITEGRNQSASGTCTDNAGNVSQPASVTGINVDKTPPTITITSPAQNAVLNTTTALVTGTASDTLSGVATLTCNGLPVAISAGSFSCSLTLPAGPDAITVQATDAAGNIAAANLNVTVTLGPAALSFTVQPGNVSAGQPIIPAVQVTLLDAKGQVLTGANDPVTISLAANAAGATLSGTLTRNAQNGVATFSGLSVNKVGKGYTLTAASSSATTTSAPFNVLLSPAQLAACVPASSQSVLVQGTNVSAYVPNGSYGVNQKNVQLVPIEGTGSRATIATPAAVTSCASNWVTGQTVCTANNTDVYLIKGSTLTNTLTSGSNGGVGFPFISGGNCQNCGVTINAVANQAVIAMGLASGPAIQILDLNTNTFATPISSNGLGISESILVDPNLNLVLSPVETKHYGLFDLNAGGKTYDFDISRLIAPGSVPDAAAEDCTTGIALASEEDSFPPQILLTDLTQARFDAASSTWTAPAQSQVFPEFDNVAPVAVGVASAVHLGIVAGESGYPEFGVIRLPSTSGSGTPAVSDYVAAVFPKDPGGQTFIVASDPHTISAYISPNDGKAYGVLPSSNPAGDRYVALVDLQGILDAPRSAAHKVDPAVDLLKAGLLRFVAIGQPPAQLAFISQLASAVAGESFLVNVAVEDALGNTDINNNFPVTLAVSGNGQRLGTATAVNGVASFHVAIQQAGIYTLSATAPTVPAATGDPLTITPAAAVTLSLITPPANIVAGQSFPTIQVGWLDQFGNPAPSNLPITLALNNGPPGVSLLGTTSVAAVNGVATFTGLTIDRSGSFTLVASGTGAFGRAQVVTTPFQVTSAAPTQLVFITQPGTALAGQVFFAPQVAVEDAFGNTLTTATNQVTLALGANPTGATLSGTLSVPANGGTASWGFVAINFAGAGYTLVASSPGLTNATSAPFNISGAGPPVSLVPANMRQGTTVAVTITATNTHFQQGVTKASFGPGLMVGGGLSGGFGPVNVTSATTATAQVSAAANATPGLRTVVLQTAAEQDTFFDAFEVLGTPYLFNISPGSGTPGQTISVTLQGLFTHFVQGTTQANFGPGISVGGGPQGGFGPVTVSAPGTASAQITIASDAAVGLRPVMVQTGAEQATLTNGGFLVLGKVTGPPPVFNFTSLTEGMEITAPTPVTETITSSNLSTWTLDYAPAGSNSFTTFATGNTTAVSGTLDPTLLLNGIIAVRLTAVDQSGQTTSATVDVVVTRNLKVGNFTISFTDLNIPVAGIPIQIVRTYDSRDKTVGDFGVGWSLSVKTVQVDVNGTLGRNWSGTKTGGLFPTFCIQPAQNHVVSVRLQNGTVYEFQPVPTLATQCSQLFPPANVDLTFVPIGATPPSAQLTQPRSAGLTVSGVFPGLLQLLDSSTFEAYGLGGNADQWILTMPNGTNVQMSRTFGVQATADTNGNTLNIGPNGITSSRGPAVSFTRDAQNRITQIQDPNFNQLQYAYDSNGNLTSFTDQRNNVSKFTYDAVHNLISFTDPSGAQPIRNVYDDSGRLIQQIDALGHVQDFVHDLGARTETFTDFLGNATTYVYDTHGNILRETDALGNVTSKTFDANDNLTSTRDPLGQVTSYTYDANNNRTSTTDPLGRVTTRTYNNLNQILTVTDANGHTTTNTYDSRGNMRSTTDPVGKTGSAIYDGGGNPTVSTDPLGNTYTSVYGAKGNLLSQTDPAGVVKTFTYDSNNNRQLESVTRTTPSGPQTLTTQYQYDAQNHLVRTILPDGSTTQTTYNSIGEKSATIDELGRQTTYQYDASGRLMETTFPDGSVETTSYDATGRRTGFTDRSGVTTAFTYDPLGRLTSTTNNGTGAVTQTTYDAAGRMASIIDPRGNLTQYVYDAAGRRTQIIDALRNVTSYAYDAAGNKVSMTDANGHRTTYLYDANDKQVQITFPDGTFATTAYDAARRATGRTDPAGKTMTYGFDALGRLITVTDALGQITRYAYDEVGNRVAQTDANNHTTKFTFDQRGRRTGRILPGGQSESFTYDARGNVISQSDFNGKVTVYTYDAGNRLLSKAPDPSFNAPTVTFMYTSSGKRATMTDASGTSTYQYDAAARLISIVKPAGTLSYSYDASGNLVSLSGGAAVSYSYDALNRLASVSEPNTGISTYSYDAVGNLASVAYPNGIGNTYTYNTKNQLTNVAVSKGASPLAGYAYTLEPAGHRLSVAELGGRMVSYTYDNIYRLTSETVTGAAAGPNGAVTYTYDPVGNRTQTTSTLTGVGSGSFTYDPDDRLSSDTYDPNGNTTASGGISNAYDFENHLVQHGRVTIVYDGDGNRVSKTAGGVTTKYLVDSLNPTGFAQVMAESDSAGSNRTFVYGLNRISQRQFVAGSGKTLTSFYVHDGHGSVRALTDATGAVTDSYDYDAFGNLIRSTGSTPNEFLFAGEQFDSDLGVYYNRARYLSTSTGRFWSMDPYGGSPTEPVSLHRYLYAGADPVDWTDPSGRNIDTILGVAVAIAAAAFLVYGVVLINHAELNGSGSDIDKARKEALHLISAVWRNLEYIPLSELHGYIPIFERYFGRLRVQQEVEHNYLEIDDYLSHQDPLLKQSVRGETLVLDQDSLGSSCGGLFLACPRFNAMNLVDKGAAILGAAAHIVIGARYIVEGDDNAIELAAFDSLLAIQNVDNYKYFAVSAQYGGK